MAALRLILLHAALAVVCSAAVEIRFVPPGGEGTVSLGIYDGQGRLVRVLCDEWPFDRFQVGLNGLSTAWDGRDAAGAPVAAGTYRARGYLVGAVEVDGEALLFNDWVGEAGAPRIVAIAAVSILPGGDLLLAARLTGDRGALLRYAPQGENRWRILAEEPLEGRVGAVQLVSSGGRAFVLFSGRLRVVDLETGQEIPAQLSVVGPRSISANKDSLAVLADGKILLLDMTNLSPRREISAPPSEPAHIALLADDSLVAAGSDGSLWHHRSEWERLEIPPNAAVRALAPGRDSTFWSAEAEDGAVAVVQYSPEEGRLAEWRSAARGEEVSALGASDEADFFAAVFDSPQRSRTVAIRRAAAGGAWELSADKSVTESSSFGWTESGISPNSGALPSTLEIPLQPNPLDASAPRTLLLRAVSNAEGTALAAADGLPVLRVSDHDGFRRVMVVPGPAPGSARFFQGDGAGVEEFALRDLGEITAFDAGTIEMEAGAEKPAPPEEDPVLPTP